MSRGCSILRSVSPAITSLTSPCWNGGHATGKLAIWEVTAAGDHVGSAPIAEFDLLATDLGVKTFTTPANYEILSPGRHYFRAEYEGTPVDLTAPGTPPAPGPQNKQTVDVDGYYGSSSADLTHDVYLSGLIGLNSVMMDSDSSTADSFDSSPGGDEVTKTRARVLSNGNITLKGKIFGNVLSATGNVALLSGSIVNGNVTGNSISGPGTVTGTRTTHASALMGTTLVPVAVPGVCTPPSSPSSITGNGKFTYNPTTGNLTVNAKTVITLAPGEYCFGSITMGGGASIRADHRAGTGQG